MLEFEKLGGFQRIPERRQAVIFPSNTKTFFWGVYFLESSYFPLPQFLLLLDQSQVFNSPLKFLFFFHKIKQDVSIMRRCWD